MRVKSEWRVPVPASSVAVRCGEGMAAVEVKQNFLGNDHLLWFVKIGLVGEDRIGACKQRRLGDRYSAASHFLHPTADFKVMH